MYLQLQRTFIEIKYIDEWSYHEERYQGSLLMQLSNGCNCLLHWQIWPKLWVIIRPHWQSMIIHSTVCLSHAIADEVWRNCGKKIRLFSSPGPVNFTVVRQLNSVAAVCTVAQLSGKHHQRCLKYNSRPWTPDEIAAHASLCFLALKLATVVSWTGLWAGWIFVRISHAK